MSITIMGIARYFPRLALTAVLVLPGVLSAAVVPPLIDIIDFGDDVGATLTATSFTIDATAVTISTGGGLIDIPDQAFTLESAWDSNVDVGIDLYEGTFTVGGGLLSGSFTELMLIDLTGGSYLFEGDVVYTSGSLKGSLDGGRIEGSFTGTVVTAELGPVVVPVPAAVWLFGSGLLGLVGIARRKAT